MKNLERDMIARMAKASLRASRMRNGFVMLTIVLASALLMGILMFAVGQQEQTQRNLTHAQQVGYYNLTEAQVEALQRDERIAYQIQVKTGVPTELDGFSVVPYYVSEMSDHIQVGTLTQGSLPQAADEVAVQGAMLERMGLPAALGTQVTFPFYDGNTETCTVTGLLAGGENASQFSLFFSQAYAETGSQLAEEPYEVYAQLYGATTMNQWDCQEAMFLIGSDAGVERQFVNPSRAFLDSLSVDSQQVLLYGLVGAVILLAAVLVIYGVFYLSVIGRVHQFGQLRTIGMTKKQMRKLVSREGRMLFLRAAPLGIVIGGVVGYFLLPAGFSILNTLLLAVGVFVVVYVITLLSVHKPAKLAAAVSPMEALRYQPQDGMKAAAGRKLCRNLTPVGLGVMNFGKNRKKATVTMLSLALGGILFMTAATYMTSFDRDAYSRQIYFKDAEAHINYTQAAIELEDNGISGLQANQPMDQAMVEEILALDGVESVQELKNFGLSYDIPTQSEYDNDDMAWLMTQEEVRTIGQYLEEGSADYDQLMSGSYVLVADNNNVEEIYGWRFQVGDQLTFHYFDGTGPAERTVTVLGILNDQYNRDNELLEGWFLLPEAVAQSWVSYDTFNTGLLVNAADGQEAAVEAALEPLVAARSELTMETLSQRQAVDAQNVNTIFGAISGLAIFIMLFSILSMMNTLITNIVTRKQELAMLESIGMGKGQVRQMLLGESLLLVLATVGVTLTVGTLCGWFLSRTLAGMGVHYMVFQFPTGFGLAYVAVLVLVPLVITGVSLRTFAKEPLVERLRGMEG